MRTRQRSTIRVARPRATWRDPRFIIGIVLVVFSIVGVGYVVDMARSGTEVYAVTTDIAPGEPLTLENMAVVEARPGADVYLAADEDITGLFARHALRQGELVARSAVTTTEDHAMRTFVINVDEGLPEGVRPGEDVELWFVEDARVGSTGLKEAQKVAEQVSVVRVISETGGIGVAAGTRLEIRTDADSMGQLLKYTQANGKLVAVPVGTR